MPLVGSELRPRHETGDQTPTQHQTNRSCSEKVYSLLTTIDHFPFTQYTEDRRHCLIVPLNRVETASDSRMSMSRDALVSSMMILVVANPGNSGESVSESSSGSKIRGHDMTP